MNDLFRSIIDNSLEDALKDFGGPVKSTKVSKHTQKKRINKIKNKKRMIKKSRRKNRRNR